MGRRAWLAPNPTNSADRSQSATSTNTSTLNESTGRHDHHPFRQNKFGFDSKQMKHKRFVVALNVNWRKLSSCVPRCVGGTEGPGLNRWLPSKQLTTQRLDTAQDIASDSEGTFGLKVVGRTAGRARSGGCGAGGGQWASRAAKSQAPSRN